MLLRACEEPNIFNYWHDNIRLCDSHRGKFGIIKITSAYMLELSYSVSEKLSYRHTHIYMV